MASIFTYETEPSRVSSPWLTPTDTPKPSTPQPTDQGLATVVSPSSARLVDHGVTRLEAEPQDGPTEYKLHLLLRPRRNCMRAFLFTVTLDWSICCLLRAKHHTRPSTFFTLMFSQTADLPRGPLRLDPTANITLLISWHQTTRVQFLDRQSNRGKFALSN